MMHKHEAKLLCEQHIHKYVLVQTTDGMHFDGIVESLDDDYVYLAVPVGAAELTPPQARGLTGLYGYGGAPWYGYPPYGYGYPYPHYGYGGRFRRLALPLAALAAISLLPYF